MRRGEENFLLIDQQRTDTLIVYQIFLTNSLRKYIDISLTRYEAGFSEPRETCK